VAETKLDRKAILDYANVVATLGAATIGYDEGKVALRAALWVMEQVPLRGAGHVRPEELKAEIERLIAEAEANPTPRPATEQGKGEAA
jgi:hypothetical protein